MNEPLNQPPPLPPQPVIPLAYASLPQKQYQRPVMLVIIGILAILIGLSGIPVQLYNAYQNFDLLGSTVTPKPPTVVTAKSPVVLIPPFNGDWIGADGIGYELRQSAIEHVNKQTPLNLNEREMLIRILADEVKIMFPIAKLSADKKQSLYLDGVKSRREKGEWKYIIETSLASIRLNDHAAEISEKNRRKRSLKIDSRILTGPDGKRRICAVEIGQLLTTEYANRSMPRSSTFAPTLVQLTTAGKLLADWDVPAELTFEYGIFSPISVSNDIVSIQAGGTYYILQDGTPKSQQELSSKNLDPITGNPKASNSSRVLIPILASRTALYTDIFLAIVQAALSLLLFIFGIMLLADRPSAIRFFVLYAAVKITILILSIAVTIWFFASMTTPFITLQRHLPSYANNISPLVFTISCVLDYCLALLFPVLIMLIMRTKSIQTHASLLGERSTPISHALQIRIRQSLHRVVRARSGKTLIFMPLCVVIILTITSALLWPLNAGNLLQTMLSIILCLLTGLIFYRIVRRSGSDKTIIIIMAMIALLSSRSIAQDNEIEQLLKNCRDPKDKTNAFYKLDGKKNALINFLSLLDDPNSKVCENAAVHARNAIRRPLSAEQEAAATVAAHHLVDWIIKNPNQYATENNGIGQLAMLLGISSEDVDKLIPLIDREKLRSNYIVQLIATVKGKDEAVIAKLKPVLYQLKDRWGMKYIIERFRKLGDPGFKTILDFYPSVGKTEIEVYFETVFDYYDKDKPLPEYQEKFLLELADGDDAKGKMEALKVLNFRNPEKYKKRYITESVTAGGPDGMNIIPLEIERSKENLEAIRNMILEGKDNDTRVKAIQMLANDSSGLDLQALSALLSDRDEQVRRTAAGVLTNNGKLRHDAGIGISHQAQVIQYPWMDRDPVKFNARFGSISNQPIAGEGLENSGPASATHYWITTVLQICQIVLATIFMIFLFVFLISPWSSPESKTSNQTNKIAGNIP